MAFLAVMFVIVFGGIYMAVNHVYSKMSYEEVEEKTKVVVKNLPVKKPTQRELALRISEDENLTVLYREAQKIVGTFGYDTQALLLMIYDYFGFSVELIVMLLSYQKNEGNLSSIAIKKRAEDWAKNGIDTLEAAVAEISALSPTATSTGAAGVTVPQP